ncbi:hypothetical protein C9417_24905 [Rhizobium sp. SEMIA 4088]|nr:hypothetical protein C9417_24905 [Rhizobium sp. SEMIA 4088]
MGAKQAENGWPAAQAPALIKSSVVALSVTRLIFVASSGVISRIELGTILIAISSIDRSTPIFLK